MRCKCEVAKELFWQELTDSITDRHGYDKVTWRELQERMDDRDRARVEVLAVLERTTPRDVLRTLSTYVRLIDETDKFQEVVNDLVGLDILCQPLPKVGV